MNPKVTVHDSPIEGNGLFATETIVKGEQLWISKGAKEQGSKIYSDEKFKEFTKWCIENDKEWDAVALGDGKHRAAISDRKDNPGNYGNHSCSPNVDKDLVVLRNILPGEEITIDYAQFSNKAWKMECNCGAESCVGIVRGSL